MRKLEFAAAWRETFAGVRADLSLYYTLAAAFVLLPTMVVAVLVSGEPATLGDIDGGQLLAQLVVTAVGAIAQFAIIVLASGVVRHPRAAISGAIAALPRLIGVIVLTAMPLVPAILLLRESRLGYPGLALPGLIVLVPGLYVAARLALSFPMLAVRGLGVVAALRASWGATVNNGWRIFGFLLAILALLLFVLLLGGGVAAAFGSVMTLIGAPGVGKFFVALIAAAVASGYAVVNSVGLAIMLKRLG